MSALMADIAADRIEVGRANAICNAAKAQLEVVKMQYRFGSEKAGRSLPLV